MKNFLLFKPDSKKILVVDGDPQMRIVLRRFLEALGFDVDCAVDGLDGLEKVRSFRPDAVVVDMNMPHMSGGEFCEALKKDPELRAIRVLILLGTGGTLPAHGLGADAYLTKPVDFGELDAELTCLSV